MDVKCHLTRRILTTLPSRKNWRVDVTFTRAITHKKHLAQSEHIVHGVQWPFSIHSAYLPRDTY